jgi:hypothetical protein
MRIITLQQWDNGTIEERSSWLREDVRLSRADSITLALRELEITEYQRRQQINNEAKRGIPY